MADKIVPDNKEDRKKDHYEEVYGYPEYEVSMCYDTLLKAQEIKSNKKKMSAIKEYSKDKLKETKMAIESIDDIDKAYNKKYGPENEGEEYYDEKKPESKEEMEED